MNAASAPTTNKAIQAADVSELPDALTLALAGLDPQASVSVQLQALLSLGFGQLPLPGAGATWQRWRALSAVAQHDLSLAKLYEGHTDAIAIIAELCESEHAAWPGMWGVWASESPGGRTTLQTTADGNVCVSGTKLWCSGALTANQALLTAWPAGSDVPQLVAVRLAQPGINIDADHWKAVGMADSMSVKVLFDKVPCTRVGKPGAYLTRPGFWQGGAGVAACWLGGTMRIAAALQASLQQYSPSRGQNNTSGFKFAALGKAYLAICQTSSTLHTAALWIDDHPNSDASRIALMARLSAEQCAKTVMDEVGHALGASPFCLDQKFARAVADLPVFVRQSHAQQDFAALGERVVEKAPQRWAL